MPKISPFVQFFLPFVLFGVYFGIRTFDVWEYVLEFLVYYPSPLWFCNAIAHCFIVCVAGGSYVAFSPSNWGMLFVVPSDVSLLHMFSLMRFLSREWKKAPDT